MSEINRELMDLLKNELLITLSFWDPMGPDKIYLELNNTLLLQYPELTVESLYQVLKELEYDKKIVRIRQDGQDQWKRVMPKRPPRWKRLLKKIIPFK